MKKINKNIQQEISELNQFFEDMEKSLFTGYSEKDFEDMEKDYTLSEKRKRGLTMGDRAVVSNNAKNLGVYLHWNGYREFVESVLAYCDLKQYRSPDSDDEYGWARLCQIIGNTLGGTLSLGVGRYERMDTDNYDNGTYIIQGWDIKDRLYKHYADNKREYSIFEALKQINERQPKEEQLKEEEIEIYAKNWEEKHLDRLKQEDKIIVEKRIKEMQDTKIDTIKEQEISYEILEKTGTTYKFDKGDDEHRR